ncbi:MAG: site-specific DNA-methyltransferase [Muribaculaceae bacterium]|nr:site-specific DNA-methyltransferase [Muribaculaceae bacterium]
MADIHIGVGSLYDELIASLKTENNFVADNGDIKKWVVAEQARAYSPELIELLLANEQLKNAFFVDVKGTVVFLLDKFLQFIEQKNYINDSYTRFTQKVGLQVGGKFLSQRNEVELVFPYKDCVLEGGQTKDDQKRNEIFFNEVLAQDEITQLLDPKVLSDAKRIDAHGEHPLDTFRRDEGTNVDRNLPKQTITDNLIIRGNNLLALHTLKHQFAGRIKLIFIDPPYNTGSDEFGYNDRFNHSTWLTFLKNRLQIAKTLLTEDGSFCMAIDHNEIGYAIVLLDEIFGRENLKNIITVKRGSVTGAKVINPGVVNLSDYVLIYSRNTKSWKPKRVLRAKQRDDRYNQFIENFSEPYEQWHTIPLGDAFAATQNSTPAKLKKQLGSRYEEELSRFVIQNAERVMQYATLDDKNISQAARDLKKKSQDNPTKVFMMEREGKSPYYVLNGKLMLFVKDRLIEIDGEKTFSEPISDIWDDVLPNDLHNEGGVIFKKGKKPEKLMQRIIELTTEVGDIVLDFHLGSGTTASSALKCKRQFIGVEQLDYGQNDSVQRLKNAIGKYVNGVLQYDTRGISSVTSWRGGGDFVYIELKRSNKKFIEDIEAATTTEQLLEIWEQMKQRAFFRFSLDMQKFEENIEQFKTLTLDEQKAALCSVFDLNQLYVNRADMNDDELQVSDEEKRVTNDFYGK